MLSELQVFNAVRQRLRELDATVLQLVAPGGQAPLGVTISKPQGRRTCYPDLIAHMDHPLLIGEMKPRYSAADHQKVVSMKTFGSTALFGLLRRQQPRLVATEIAGLLCHSQTNYPELDDVGQWVFDEGLHLIASVNMPF